MRAWSVSTKEDLTTIRRLTVFRIVGIRFSNTLYSRYWRCALLKLLFNDQIQFETCTESAKIDLWGFCHLFFSPNVGASVVKRNRNNLNFTILFYFMLIV